MTLPATPPHSSGLRRHSGRLSARRIFLCLAILAVLFLWSSARLYLRIVDNDSSSKEGKQQVDLRPRKRPRAAVSRTLPPWKQEEHASEEVTLTGSYRYNDVPFCTRRVACGLYFPSIDLSTRIPHDEAASVARIRVSNSPPPLPQYLTQNVTSFPDHTLLTRCGYKSGATGVKVNQDRTLLLSPFARQDLLLGLFDGHGADGHIVSHHAALQLPTILSKHLQSKLSPQEALVKTFLDLDETVPPSIQGSGSTGIVMMQSQQQLYVANVGDSLAMLISCNEEGENVQIIYTTKPHKPHLPEERARIEAAGGTVQSPQSASDSSRVIIPVPGGMIVGLAMSRSIGDHEGTPVGVTAEPTIDVLQVDSSKNIFVVAASDGLFDHVPALEVATQLAKSFFKNGAPSPLDTSEALIMKASKEWIANGLPYRDDITVAAAKLL